VCGWVCAQCVCVYAQGAFLCVFGVGVCSRCACVQSVCLYVQCACTDVCLAVCSHHTSTHQHKCHQPINLFPIDTSTHQRSVCVLGVCSVCSGVCQVCSRCIVCQVCVCSGVRSVEVYLGVFQCVALNLGRTILRGVWYSNLVRVSCEDVWH
jgi:hypothetical protein